MGEGGVMATLKDIAELAKVSTTTVSRILNNDFSFSVRDETKEKVLKAAAELNYELKDSSTISKNFKRKRFGIVQWISSYEEEQDPYYLSIRQSVENYCIENKIFTDRYFMENISELYENNDLDGLVCIGKFSLEMAEKLADHSANIIFIDSSPDSKRYSSIVNDLKSGTYEIVNYLKEMGHKHIGFIGGREYLDTGDTVHIDVRESTFRKIIEEDKEIKTNEQDIFINRFNHQTGYDSMMAAFKNKDMPSVFICESDTIAMGALSALGELDAQLSKKVSIISYNNIKSAEYMNPPLTTLSLNTKYMGELAGNLLIHMIDSKYSTPVEIKCATKLMIRESVYKN